jgi:hypothetical protein
MGASVTGYWPGITDEQRDAMPGFVNDDKAFGDWIANRAERAERAEALEHVLALGCGAILTFTTDGLDDSDVDWVTPAALKSAALTLRELVLRKDPRARGLIESYAVGANLIEAAHEEFAQDLDDVAQIAAFAADLGVSRMTLEVNW